MPLIRKPTSEKTPVEPRSAIDSLVLLTSGGPQERWAAARAAADLPGGVEALGQALLSENDPRVREAIFTSLARLRTEDSLHAVLPHLRSDDANLRTGALDALRTMPEAVGPVLPVLLSDEDPDVRLLACELVVGLPDSEATRLMCDLLEREREINVCAAAINVLAEIGGPEALPALTRCAERFADNAFLGFSIKVASERIGSGAASTT